MGKKQKNILIKFLLDLELRHEHYLLLTLLNYNLLNFHLVEEEKIENGALKQA